MQARNRSFPYGFGFCVFWGCGKETVATVAPSVISTVPIAGAIGIPVNQVISATFNEPMSASTISATTFLLTGPGATAVAGTVSYTATGSVASFAPTAVLAFNTTYTATITNAVTNTVGVKPAGAYTWSFTTATQPTVIATLPANGATLVPTNQVLTATFSKMLNPATVNATTFLLKGPGGTAVTGTVTYNPTGSVASFTPSVALTYNTAYTATITIGVTDSTGDPLTANYSWSFTTAVQPVVLSTVPLNGATGVALNQVVSATFSQTMNCASLASPATSFTLTGPGTTAVAGTVACSGAIATFTPSANLVVNTVYTAMITTGAQSVGGAPLAANYVWMFRTLPAPTPPTVISTVPANLAVGVPINQALSATFSVAMTPATINATTFTLTGPGAAPVTGIVTYAAAGSTATFTPSAPLAYNTPYTATITTGAQNLAGHRIGSELRLDIYHRCGRRRASDGDFDYPCDRSYERAGQSGN